jgi:hypothetical protein
MCLGDSVSVSLLDFTTFLRRFVARWVGDAVIRRIRGVDELSGGQDLVVMGAAEATREVTRDRTQKQRRRRRRARLYWLHCGSEGDRTRYAGTRSVERNGNASNSDFVVKGERSVQSGKLERKSEAQMMIFSRAGTSQRQIVIIGWEGMIK